MGTALSAPKISSTLKMFVRPAPHHMRPPCPPTHRSRRRSASSSSVGDNRGSALNFSLSSGLVSH
eukprot:9495406-Pyramimonas_sp.AAC.1